MTNKTINPDYVCGHCGVPVRFRAADWRHIGNRYMKGCGQSPRPEPRALYEYWQQQSQKVQKT